MFDLLSVIVPVYNEQDSLVELHTRINDSVKGCVSDGLVKSWDIWFISDGSTDDSEAVIKSLIKKDDKVRLISFRRNFGKAKALMAGFNHAEGDVIVTMDADLQDDPKEIKRFLEKLDEGFDLVSGWKKKRHDPLNKRLPSKLFNAVTKKMSGVKLNDFNCGFKAYRKQAVKNINLYGELHRYIPVLVARSGFRIAEIAVEHHKREHGHTKYGFERYLRGLFDSITTSFLLRFYDKPMYFFGSIGLVTFFIGFVICFILVIEWLKGNAIGTRPLLTLGVLLIMLGVQFISTGLIGNMFVEGNFKRNYSEEHFKEVIKPQEKK